MQAYEAFMRRQRLPDDTHQKLLELEKPPYDAKRWERWGAVAAALIIAVGAILFVWRYVNQYGGDRGVTAQATPSANLHIVSGALTSPLPMEEQQSAGTQDPARDQGASDVPPSSQTDVTAQLTIQYVEVPDTSSTDRSVLNLAPSAISPDVALTILWDAGETFDLLLQNDQTGGEAAYALSWLQDYDISGWAAYSKQNVLELIVISGYDQNTGTFSLYIPISTIPERLADLIPQLPSQELPYTYLASARVKGWVCKSLTSPLLCTVTSYNSAGIFFQNTAYRPEPYTEEAAEAAIQTALLRNDAVMNVLCAVDDTGDILPNTLTHRQQEDFIPLAGIPLGAPLEELSPDLLSQLTPSGGPIDQNGEGFGLYQWYDGPGLRVLTTRVTDETLAQWASTPEEFDREQGREYVASVEITSPDYPSPQGFRVGDKVVKDTLNGYAITEGENFLGGAIRGLRVYVEKGRVVRMVSTDGGRMVGSYFC